MVRQERKKIIMAKIIILGAMKGGVGKSVSVFNLVYSLAELGKKELTVDFDSQLMDELKFFHQLFILEE